MKQGVLKGGLILALASLLGFISNFIFSVFLEKDAYGEIVTLFSLVSILVLVTPLGTNVFFLSHREIYLKSENAIVILPALLSTIIGVGFLIDQVSLMRIAFVALLIVSTLSVQGLMSCQVKQDSEKAAIYQSMQAFLKSAAALAVLTTLVIGDEGVDSKELFAIGLLISSLIALPLMLWRIIDLRSGGRLFDITFLKSLTKYQWISLVSFWLSSILGVVYSLGIIPLVSYFHGYNYAAYLGIYFIFWSGGNILITMSINNYYWPKFCAIRAAGANESKILLESLRVSLGVAVLTFLGTLFFALFISHLVWDEYSEIAVFLAVVSLAISIRVFSAWLGMMILSFDQLIIRKTRVQLAMVLAMVLCVALLDIASYQILAWLLVMLELGYFMGFLLSSSRVLKNNYLKIYRLSR